MSTSESGKYALLDQLAEEFAERWRRGERPSLAEYVERYPDLADDIQELFPAMAEIEQAEGDRRVAVEPAPAPPLQMLGDYRILREIGHGGMGIVYEAEQVSLGRHVALKVLPRQTLADPQQRRRFEREARTAARLHHTNIVPIFGVGEHEGQPYFVMQFIQGLGLDEVLKALQQLQRGGGEPAAGQSRKEAAEMARSLLTGEFRPGLDLTADALPRPDEPPAPAGDTSPVGWLSDSLTLSASSAALAVPGGEARPVKRQTYWQQVATLGLQVADALDHAHKMGVLHRDIKPSNLLLDLHGTAWVTDFGLAKASDNQNLTQTGDVVGTLRYLPPEAFEGRTDARSDLYALGLTLYELLAFRPAFDAQDRARLLKQVMGAQVPRLRQVNPQVPRDLETIVHKAIERDPAHRYQSAGELEADLQRFLEDEPIRARRISTTERLLRWAGRNRLLAAALAAVALLGVTITVGSILLAAHFRQEEAMQRGLVQEKGTLASQNQQLADRNKQLAETAETALRQAKTVLVDMHTARGLQAAERDDAPQAALWFATAAEQATADPQREADSRLRARNWARAAVLPVSAFSLPEGPSSLEFPRSRPLGDLLLLRTKTRAYIWDMRQDRFLPWADGKPAGAACWSPDGTNLALALGRQVQIRSVPDGTILRELPYPGTVSALAYSRDGRYLAIASDVVRLWDSQAKDFLKSSWRHPQKVEAMLFNAKGDRLITACQDKMARVFAVNSGPAQPGPLFAVPHQPHDPSPPALIDKDEGLVTITGERALTWWDAEADRPTLLQHLATKEWQLLRVVASHGGNWFATGGNGKGPELWNTADRAKKAIVLDHINYVRDLAFSPDDRTLLSVSWDQTARLWSLPEGRPLGPPLAHMGDVRRCCFSSDGTYLATARSDGAVRIWKRPVPDQVQAQFKDWGLRARVSRNGWLLAPGCWHETPFSPYNGLRRLVVRDAVTGQPAGPVVPLGMPPLDSCIISDNRSVAVISVDASGTGWFSVWDVPTGKARFQQVKLPGRPQSVAASPSAANVAVLCQGGELLVFDDRTGKLVLELRHEGWRGVWGNMARVEYTADGATLVSQSGYEDGVHVWDAATGQHRQQIRPILKGGPCRTFALSADSRLLATGVNGVNAAQVWDLATGRALSEPLPHPGDLYGLWSVCFSPDGSRLLTGCKDGQVRLWDWKAGALVCPPMQHPDEVYAVLLTADGRHALTAVRDQSAGVAGVYVWDLATGKLLAPPLRFPASVQALTLSPDGKQVYACCGDSLALIPLAPLLDDPEQTTADLRLLAEVASAQRLDKGDVSGLTWEQWLERWERFHQQQPPFSRPTLAEALARGTEHRRAAQGLLHAGRPTEALARWRQALLAIEGAAGSDAQRHALRTEMMAEARTLLENRLAGQPDGPVAELLADLLLESRPPPDWTVLKPTEMTTTSGTTLSPRPDGSILAAGPNPDNETCTIVAATDRQGLTALRLEVLPDPSLPNHGPGRSRLGGNLCLTEISLAAASAEAPDHQQTVPFTRAAGYQRTPDTDTTPQDGPRGAIDGDQTTRWDIWPLVGQTHAVVFQMARPLPGGSGTLLTIRLDCQHPVHKEHTLGRFRLAVTTRPHPVLDETLAQAVEDLHGWTRLAAAHLLRGEEKEALAALRQAVAGPTGGTAHDHLLLALAHEQLGQHAEALQAYEQATPLVANNRANRALLGLAVEVVSESIARDPGNARLRRHRARWQTWLGLQAEAAADLAQAHELEPNRPAGLEEAVLLALQGDQAARQGDWEQASAAYQKAAALAEAPAEASYLHALLRLYLGDTDGYRNACAALLERHGKPSDSETARFVVLACALSPLGVSDPQTLLPLVAKTGNPRFRAAALFRASPGEAVKLLETFPDPVMWLRLSLAYRRLDRPEDARRWLLKAQQWLDQAQKQPNVAFDGQPAWKSIPWPERLQVQVLRREAEAGK